MTIDLPTAPDGTALFFGCIGEPGHYLRSQERGSLLFKEQDYLKSLFRRSLDGGFAPPVSQDQGAGMLTHLEGWTILGWHDYTGDKRGGSNSNFLVKGTYSWEQMTTLFMHAFPTVYNRQNKQIANRTLG